MYIFKRDTSREIVGATLRNPLDYRIARSALGWDDPVIGQIREQAKMFLPQATDVVNFDAVVASATMAMDARGLGFVVALGTLDAQRLHAGMRDFVAQGSLGNGNHLTGSAKSRTERLRHLTRHMLTLSEHL